MAEKGLVNRNMASLGIFIGILRKLEILKKTVCKKQGKFSFQNSKFMFPIVRVQITLYKKSQTLKYFGEVAVPQKFYQKLVQN